MFGGVSLDRPETVGKGRIPDLLFLAGQIRSCEACETRGVFAASTECGGAPD